jgi:hypothetical protein
MREREDRVPASRTLMEALASKRVNDVAAFAGKQRRRRLLAHR